MVFFRMLLIPHSVQAAAEAMPAVAETAAAVVVVAVVAMVA